MKPQLPDDDVGQYQSLLGRLARLEAAISPEAVRVVGAVGQPAFQNGWGSAGGAEPPPGFYRHLGRVYLRGSLSGGTIGLAAFTLPSLYRPIGDEWHVNVVPANIGYILIKADGQVVPQVGASGGQRLNGISFRCA